MIIITCMQLTTLSKTVAPREYRHISHTKKKESLRYPFPRFINLTMIDVISRFGYIPYYARKNARLDVKLHHI